VTTITNVIAPEEDEVANIQNPQGGNFMRNFGDGETKTTTYLRNHMVKTVLKNDMTRSTIIRDNELKKTTTLLEIMGNKSGFFVTDQEQAEMKKRLDSMMANRKDSSARPRNSTPASEFDIVYTSDTKKIAGYNAKKAYIVRTNILGKDSLAVWYTPDIKLLNVPSTGGTSSFGNMMMMNTNTHTNSFDKIDGFVLQYETKMPRGRRMTVEVTKIELDKEIKDKEYDIPKDFEVKPMKDFRMGMPGGPGTQREIRIGG